MESGWKMDDIDRMDMLGYLYLRAWKARKEKTPQRKFIDEIWPKGLG